MSNALRSLNADTTNRTRKTAKQIFAATAAVPAKVPNPITAAINAATRNISAQESMVDPSIYQHDAVIRIAGSRLF